MLQLNSAVGVCASSGVDVLISKESRGGGSMIDRGVVNKKGIDASRIRTCALKEEQIVLSCSNLSP